MIPALVISPLELAAQEPHDSVVLAIPATQTSLFSFISINWRGRPLRSYESARGNGSVSVRLFAIACASDATTEPSITSVGGSSSGDADAGNAGANPGIDASVDAPDAAQVTDAAVNGDACVPPSGGGPC
jgi:hypothetical protein